MNENLEQEQLKPYELEFRTVLSKKVPNYKKCLSLDVESNLYGLFVDYKELEKSSFACLTGGYTSITDDSNRLEKIMNQQMNAKRRFDAVVDIIVEEQKLQAGDCSRGR